MTRRQDPTRRPYLQTHLNPPSVAYTNGANPGDAEAVVGKDPWAHLYRHTCPGCGGPAHLSVFEVSTYDDPAPRRVRQLICKDRTNARRPKDGPPPCPIVDMPEAEETSPGTALPSLRPTRRQVEE
jgi:hypothetical protein